MRPSSSSARRRAALPTALEHLAAVADDDPLVGLLRDVDRHGDAHELRVLVERLDRDRDAVRDLLARAAEDLLAHELADEEAHRPVAELLGVEERLALGEELADLGEDGVQAVAP